MINPNDLDRHLTGSWGEDSLPDPEPDEPDFYVMHCCGHQFGYWQYHQPSAGQPCPICQPCPGCGKAGFACECPFVDPFSGE